ncbi:MAG: nucleotidyltransferase domain-containing protein [Alcanivorax sp.]
MTSFNPSDAINPKIKEQILKTLDKIEEDHEVQILHAIESGSRAWGFHSPNSDYDVRFFYVHKRDWYLSIYPGRDVIEIPIDEVYDVSGWDLKKTLHLAMKSNAVVMEWLQSPITYRTNDDFTKSLGAFCNGCFNEKALIYHYVNLGLRQNEQTWRTSDTTQIKKYFYMIRPAMALRWMQKNPDNLLVPMNIQELMGGAEVPSEIHLIMNELIARKMQSEEKEMTQRVKELDDFIFNEYEEAEKRALSLPSAQSKDNSKADDVLRKWLS